MGDVVVADFQRRKVVPRAVSAEPTSLAIILANRAHGMKPEKAVPMLLNCLHKIIESCEQLRDSSPEKYPDVIRSLARIFLKEIEATTNLLEPRA